MGLEIVATLFALKLRHPASIYLLRGNHECSEITVLFGFCGECQRRSTLAVWEAVMQAFDALPLAALLNSKVFLCHGGISPYMHHPHDVNAIRRPLVGRGGEAAGASRAAACFRRPPAALAVAALPPAGASHATLPSAAARRCPGCQPQRRGPAIRPAVGRPLGARHRVGGQPARRLLCLWPGRGAAVAAGAGAARHRAGTHGAAERV